MTEPTASALRTALAYHRSWTSHDLDAAMSHVAEDITCQAPGATITGAGAYRQFLGGFTDKLTGITTLAAFGDDTTALLLYYPHTPNTTNAPTAEHFTVVDAKITATVLVFDRLSFTQPQTSP